MVAILFPGQGSQFMGMGQDFYDEFLEYRNVFDQIDPDCLRAFNDEKQVHLTKYAQQILYLNHCGIMNVIKSKFELGDVSYCGFSLGEYQAFLQSNVFDFKTGLNIVKKRSLLMSDVVSDYELKVVMNLDILKLEQIVEYLKTIHNIDVQISNYNLEKQILVAIKRQDLEKVTKILKDHGAKRVMDLNVSGPFHTDVYTDASIEFKKYLDEITLNQPTNPIYLNLTGDLYNNENLKVVMMEHMTNGVLFYLQVQAMLKAGITTFVEVGSGSVLASMVKKIDKTATIIKVDSVDKINELELIWKRK